ncbi:MAG: hypothetical protein ACO1ON_01450 [Nocardioides sp.]
MGIEQHHPDPAADPPTAAPAVSDSAGLPGMMEQLTRALLHVTAAPGDLSPDPTIAAPSATPTEVADETGSEVQPLAAAVEADVPAEPTVTPPAPRRPGAVLGELAFLDE